MYNFYSVNQIRNLMDKYGLNFSKRWGQNFLINPSVCSKTVSQSGIDPQSGVIEVGPGIGTLTCEIARKAKKVVSVEIDSRLMPLLRETTSEYENVKILNSDILELDVDKIISEEFDGIKNVTVCANLPYYITTPIVMKFLESTANISTITVMVQRETAVRICALPGTRECGAISFAVRYYGIPTILFNVSKESFIPSPSIESSVLSIKADSCWSGFVKDRRMFFKVIKAGFAQRRKTLVNSLSSGLSLEKDKVKNLLYDVGVPLNSRAEQISFVKFAQISDAMAEESQNT